MSNKFEQLIELIINEDQEQARAMFHDIVVEKSREIYEDIMAEEDMVGDLMTDVEADQDGADEDFDDAEGDFADAEEDFDDAEADELDGEADEFDAEEDMEDADIEDRVVDLEDKLDELMAEFEEIVGGNEEAEGEDEFEAGEDEEEAGEDEFEAGEDEEETGEDEEGLMEDAKLSRVAVKRNPSVAIKSPVDANSGKYGMESKPVDFSAGGAEKGRKAPSVKAGKSYGNSSTGRDNVKTSAVKKPANRDMSANTRSTTAK